MGEGRKDDTRRSDFIRGLLNNPRYISMAADYIRNTGLTGQCQALDKDQQQGFNGGK